MNKSGFVFFFQFFCGDDNDRSGVVQCNCRLMKIYILGGINSYHYGYQYSRLDRVMRKESDPSRILIQRKGER